MKSSMKMLDVYMKTDEYIYAIEKVVNDNPEYKAMETEFLSILDRLGLDSKTYSLIDDQVIQMMYTARDIGYREGFRNGVRMIVECVSGGAGK